MTKAEAKLFCDKKNVQKEPTVFTVLTRNVLS